MRITDLMISNDYLYNLTATKSKLNDLQTEIATGNKIQKPSDSPDGTVNIIGWNNRISQANTLMSNIDDGQSFVNDSTQAMQNIQDQITTVLSNLTQVQNATNSQNLNNFAQEIDSSLSLILDSANSKSNGKYIFGGTDNSSAPFGYSSDGKSIEVKGSNISGTQSIYISPDIKQQINFSGTDVFGTIVKGNGNIDSSTAVGQAVSGQTNVYDASGNQYTFKTSFTKTGADTYSFTYDVLDSNSNSVLVQVPAAQTFVFNSSTGNLQTVDGKTPSQIQVNVPSSNINFSFDPSALTEKSSSSSLSFNANQKTDIFNTLLTIGNNLNKGIKPTAEQVQAVNNFNSRLLDNISMSGNISDRLTNSKNLLNNQTLQLQGLVSDTQSVDVAKAVVNLQNQDALLQMAYKMAASVLPQSILNYL